LGSSPYDPDAPIDRPVVPQNLDISPGEPRSFTIVPDDSPILNLNILWVQERNPNILFLVYTGTFMCIQLNTEHLYINVYWSSRKRNPPPKWRKT
jgi:hypothetical protein